jgi:superoxide dismutase, Cu-Zn family
MSRSRLAVVAGLFFIAACEPGDPQPDQSAIRPDTQGFGSGQAVAGGPAAPGTNGTATVAMRDRAGRDLGTLTVREEAQGVRVEGHLHGLPPGTRAIHFHNTGACEPPFETAGPHFNPAGRQHGLQNPEGPHAGDMENITVANDSSVQVNVPTPPVAALRGENGMLTGDGTSIVIHAGPDDHRTDPSGNSGDRIACGVLTGA